MRAPARDNFLLKHLNHVQVLSTMLRQRACRLLVIIENIVFSVVRVLVYQFVVAAAQTLMIEENKSWKKTETLTRASVS